MLVSSPRGDPGYGSYRCAPAPASGQVIPGNHRQAQPRPRPSHPGWLLGNLEVQAPPATWARYPNKPYIEEFVPPNPPQALGEGKEKMLAWPTTATFRNAPTYSGVGDVRQYVSDGQDESSPTGYQSFFRQQMLKQNREASEDAEMKFVSGSPVDDNNNNNIHRDISQEFRDLFDLEFDVDQRSPSTGKGTGTGTGTRTTSSDSHHAQSSDPSTSTTLGKRQRGRINRLPPGYSTQTVLIHVQTSKPGQTSSIYRNCDLPDNLSLQLPLLTQPFNPTQLRTTLLNLTPTIIYAEFLCADVCRTRGICVHFSFVLGCKKAPDGLICTLCRARGVEKAVHAERMCARHNDRRFASFTVNLAEDVLATEAQAGRAHEILMRSLRGDWEGVEVRREGMGMGMGKGVGESSQRSSMVPIRSVDGHVAAAAAADDCDIAVSSIETIHEHGEQVAKRIKMNGRDEEVKHDHNAYSNGNGNAQVPRNMEEEEQQQQQQFIFDDAYTADLKAFMDDANQGYDVHGSW